LYLRKIIYHARLINLLIVGITQSIIIFLLFKHETSGESNASLVYFAIIACTILISLGGYLINDYFDYEIDSINKRPKHRFDKAQLLQSYFISNIAGFGIGCYVCSLVDNYYYLLVYILAIVLLFLYASHFKKQGLVGNMIVSLFSSLVIALLWYVQAYFGVKVDDFQQSILIFFMSFIFLSSMARELVKDCQDLEGDKAFGLFTLPIRIGIEKTGFFIGLFLIVLLIVLVSWIYWLQPYRNLLVQASLLPIILINIYLVFKNFKARSKKDFAFISNSIKVMMALGIISLALISYQS